ncbi:hypothetical protein [Streptobacillus moniliformis]|uniref:hypothetical protein n=1 Tax=Streptobacillus moniliformis TaxID=34105 RepID=UPI0007E45F25|nr:hypothetical protein [Streptobacillus moniliformis]
MNLSNLIPKVNLKDLTKEQLRSIFLSWVAEHMHFRLKDYNIKNKPTGYSTRLWVKGRKSKTFTKMNDLVNENINIHVLAANNEAEVKEILQELSNDIVEQSLIISQDLINNALNAKTEKVRKSYMRALESPEYLKVAFILSVIFYARSLLEKGQDISHITLTSKINALDEKQQEFKEIWKEYTKSPKNEDDYLKAIQKTKDLFESFQNEFVVKNNQLNELAEEKLLYMLVKEKELENLIEDTTDKIRLRITGQYKLF